MFMKKKKESRIEFIVARVTPTEKERLIKKSGKNLSLLIRRALGLKD